ncbi:transcriptional regulator, GntR family [Catenulispora acidiphila DSM 44928]|uniref:Transcriptional regulator, GntR family n=1 Tax=Catenulispora acidiphila (strain DSM 44928 / JCM 14897 / NBRC 102108 / NRRL B-24433 / ID139908) TaxID=479433 RepID=C7PY65_CATAD|nr:GntR family transcriptional regulator [Catenulispora acidiphila]ACU75355.1 transcriptional regulator, GntR family [Catenulispora acidiphila DSM 44928]
MAVDAVGGFSKRERIREHLLDLVETLGPGGAIPSERRLCDQLGVSRPTVRAAVDDLVRDGLLIRRHGQGMFVAQPKIAQNLVGAGSARHAVAGVDGVWSSRTVGFQETGAGARVGKFLRLAPSARVLRISRLRFVDAEPMSLDTLHIPAELVPGLTAGDLERHSFYDLLESRYGIGVATATQTIEPTALNADEAALLGVPEYDPALLFERVTEDEQGRVVEFAHAVYRRDRYRIVSQLTLSKDRRRGRVLSGAWSTAAEPVGVVMPADPFFAAPVTGH